VGRMSARTRRQEFDRGPYAGRGPQKGRKSENERLRRTIFDEAAHLPVKVPDGGTTGNDAVDDVRVLIAEPGA
jgi:hypothetical protein